MIPNGSKSRRGTVDLLARPRHDSSYRKEQPASTRPGHLKLTLLSALVFSLTFVWFPKLSCGRWLPAPLSFRQASQLELEQSAGPSVTAPPTPRETASVLECFQVAQPVPAPHALPPQLTADDGLGATGKGSAPEPCSVLLMEHVFGFSYGMPFVGNYTPPNCTFNRVIMNFTVISQGRQFDRLALMYFGDTEVWRTSTAEPTRPPGIRWTYSKDMTEYLYFWKSPQKLIFDLGNLLDDKYTASFNATLAATFFTSRVGTEDAPPADVIIPISARKGATNGVSQFTLPAENATNTISFPQNVNRAIFSVSANGQASEEFWWSNVLQSDVLTFGQTAGQLPGLSPFREVQVLIDGNLAGVQWPFPVIFTGGVVPSLHRPIVGLQAFDLREHQIDITPWLPVLCDGAQHTFAIRVAGLNNSEGSPDISLTEAVNDSWYVTGKIFVWLDEAGSVTTGIAPAVELIEPSFSFSRYLTQNATGVNETLAFNITVGRAVSIKSSISSKNQAGEYTWSQTLAYSNGASVSNFGFTQVNDFTINGVDSAIAPTTSYRAIYTYPLHCNQTYSMSPQGNLTISARLIEGLELHVEGSSVFPTGLEAFESASGAELAPYTTSHLKTYRDGAAFFSQTGDRKDSSGYGSTNQVFHFGGSRGNTTVSDGRWDVDELYFRNVTAVNGTITSDSERRSGVETYDFNIVRGPGNPTETSLALFAIASEKVGGLRRPLDRDARGKEMPTRPSVQIQIP